MEKNLLEKRKQVLENLMKDKQYVPMKIKELAIILQIPRENRGELLEVLDELVKDGKIEQSKRGKYRIAEEHVLTGKFVGNARGFGFVETEDSEEDIFISEANQGNALHGDIVQVSLLRGKTGKRREGVIVKVLSH